MTTNPTHVSVRPFVPNLLILFFMIGASVHYAGLLPVDVPTRFDLHGQAVEHGSRSVVLALLPVIFALNLLFLPLLIFSVTKDTSAKMQKTTARTNTAVGALLASVHMGFLLSAANPKSGLLEAWMVGGLALFILVLARVLGDVEPNRFIGVRTPWSLASRRNWEATHRFASRVASLTGLLLLAANLFARPSWFLALATLLFTMMIPVFYSLWYYQNLESPGAKPEA